MLTKRQIVVLAVLAAAVFVVSLLLGMMDAPLVVVGAFWLAAVGGTAAWAARARMAALKRRQGR